MTGLFSTPKKAVISTLCIVFIVLAVIGVIVYFALRGGLIGKAEASDIALANAGFDESDVTALKSELDYDDGHFTYEVKFYINGVEYEYVISAKDGDIIKSEIDGPQLQVNTANNSTAPAAQTDSTADTSSSEADVPVNISSDSTAEISQPAADEPAVIEGITLNDAKKIALDDAGVNEADAQFVKQQLDRDDQFDVFDIEFTANGYEYDYEINAADGTIRQRDIELAETAAQAPAADNSSPADNGTTEQPSGDSGSPADTPAASDIGEDKAKEIALADAGVSANDAKFVKAQLDYDDGISIYDVEFTANGNEYDYEINSADGSIHKKDIEIADKKPTAPTTSKDSADIGIDKAKEIALSDAGVSANNADFTKTKSDRDDGISIYEIEFTSDGNKYEYEIKAADGSVIKRDVEYAEKKPAAPSADGYIGVDKAKEIALADAGVSANDAVVTKAKLDSDDGVMEYEIEFYSGRTEYEYSIEASGGKILDHDVDYD